MVLGSANFSQNGVSKRLRHDDGALDHSPRCSVDDSARGELINASDVVVGCLSAQMSRACWP